MPNFLKKASKRTSEVCRDGESGAAALFIRPAGDGNTKRLGTPGGALAKMAPLADQVGETAGDTRAALFTQNAVMVLTDERLLVFGHGSFTGRVRKLVGEVELADVTSLSLQSSEDSPGTTMAIEFADGETVTVAPGSRREGFVTAFDAAKQPA